MVICWSSSLLHVRCKVNSTRSFQTCLPYSNINLVEKFFRILVNARFKWSESTNLHGPSVMVVEVRKTSVTHQPKISIYQVKALSPVEIYICHSVKLFIVWTIEASEGWHNTLGEAWVGSPFTLVQTVSSFVFQFLFYARKTSSFIEKEMFVGNNRF